MEEGFSNNIRNIKELATGEVNRNRCYEVLQEFRSACNPDEDSCDEPNSQTFQLSTEQVCSAVDSRTKLDVTATGNLFDFQNYAVPQPYTTGTSNSEPVYLRAELAVVCCKDDDGDADNEKWKERSDGCPLTSNDTGGMFLAYPSAKELCEEEEGRVCTKDELERNCGDGWPGGQLVWSSTEATDDIACPAISSDICSEFVVELDKMYGLFNTYEHLPDKKGPKCDDGYELTEAECEEAGKQLNIGQDREFKVGTFSNTPCGCFLCGANQLHYDKGTTCVTDDKNSKGIVCKTNAYGLFPAGPRCPQGTELTEVECQLAGEELGFLPDERGPLVDGSWGHTPCGCFLWGANRLHFDKSSTCVATDPDYFGYNKGVVCKGNPNPMRVNPLQQVQSDFKNVQFPVEFDRVLSPSGMELIEGYEYYSYRTVFITSETYNGDLREDESEFDYEHIPTFKGPNCPSGFELTLDECREAAEKLNLGSLTVNERDFTPCGCFLWSTGPHWDSGGRGCSPADVRNMGMICKMPLADSGILGADAKCQAHANDAGLRGNYKAWISDLRGTPSSNFENFKNDDGSIPFQLVDGTIIADNWDDLLDGSLQHPIDMDENGVVVGSPFLPWTNTRNDGGRVSSSSFDMCTVSFTTSGWVSSSGNGIYGGVGDSRQVDARWTQQTGSKCSDKRRLYCFQQSPVSIEYLYSVCIIPNFSNHSVDNILLQQELYFTKGACGAALGPPSELAQACDRSMNFLLGKEMSTGMLASIAKSVLGMCTILPSYYIIIYHLTVFCASHSALWLLASFSILAEVPEQKFIPKWVPWYTSLVDAPVIERNNEFLDYYLNITNPMNDPQWLSWYLSLRDDHGFVLPNPNGGTFFCNDQEILGDQFSTATLRNCQEVWLHQFNNPYTSKYEAISYPDNPDLLPFNESSCDAFSTCQLEWLDTSTNPFSDGGTSGADVYANVNVCGVDSFDAERNCETNQACPRGDIVSCCLLIVRIFQY